MKLHGFRAFLVASLIGLVVSAAWLLVPPPRRTAYPPPAGSLPAAEARAAVTRVATAERVNVADLAVPLAPSRIARFELLIDGTSFFPRILDDIRAARSSVHIVQYGIRPARFTTSLGRY